MKLSNNPTSQLITELLYDRYYFLITDIIQNKESLEYEAYSFKLKNKTIISRTSKITPKKNGQFVTFWKRSGQGVTQSFEDIDHIDFVVINSKYKEHLGQFIFPKTVLIEKGIIRSRYSPGKRGFRVYPQWDIPLSKGAINSQEWQLKYFLP